MKKFLIKISTFLTIFFVVVVFVNFLGDAGALFYNKKLYLDISKSLLKGEYVNLNLNIDERLLQKSLIENQKTIPGTIILGSSRVMQINNSILKKDRFFNHGVSGASIEDIAAILELYKKKYNKIPKNVILGLDPWSLNSNNGQKRYISLYNEYKSFFHYKSIFNKDIIRQKIVEWKQLISPSYFYNSARLFFSFGSQVKIFQYFKKGIALRLPDGSILYDNSIIGRNQNQVLMEVQRYIKGDIYSVEEFNNIDSLKKSELHFIIFYLIKNKCNVTLYLSPYHPIVYDYLKKTSKYNNIFQSEILFQHLAHKYNLKIKGSFSPYNLNLTSKDFLDGMHTNKFTSEFILLK